MNGTYSSGYAAFLIYARTQLSSIAPVGVLTGIMWLPLSGLLRHWIGLFHGVVRTVGIVVVWYLLPEARFVAVPAVIVVVYLVTIFVLARRYTELGAGMLSRDAV